MVSKTQGGTYADGPGEEGHCRPKSLVWLVPVLLEIFLKLLRLLVSDLNRTNIIIRLFQPDRTIAYVLA